MFGSRRHGDDAPTEVLLAGLLCLAIAIAPFTVVLNAVPQHYDVDPVLFIGDVPLAVFTVAVVAVTREIDWRRPAFLVLLALAGWLAFALALNPSLRGSLLVFRMMATVAAAAWLASVDRRYSRPVVWTLAITAALQAVLGMAQVASGGAVGLTTIGEAEDPLSPFGASAAPMGTMAHPYVLAGWALVAAVGGAVFGLPSGIVALAAIPVGLTFSRAGALGLVVATVALLACRRRCTLAAALALVVGAGLPAVIQSEGWQSRVEQTTSARTERQLTTERGELARQALEITGDHPVTGVGPGQYATEPGVVKIVHNVPLLLSAEAGVIAGLLSLALLVSLGLEGGRRGMPLLLAWVPFFLLDHFPYDFPQGLLATGVWAGTLMALRRPPSGAPEAPA